MQKNSARTDRRADDEAARAADDEINARLVEHIRANAVKAGASVLEVKDDRRRLPQRGFFGEVAALFGLVGLMAVAFVYARLVDKEA